MTKMKTQKKELDVDVIGGMGPLTKEEEKTITKFIKSNKLRKARLNLLKVKSATRKKVLA